MRQGLNKINHLVNPTKNGGKKNFIPVLLGNINGRLCKAKFHSLIIIQSFGESSLMVIGNHTKNATKTPNRSNGAPKAVTF